MNEADHPLTSGGNPKAPPPEVYLGWITVAWKHLKNQREYLASSFKTCGITTALDGSEDELIHCLKPGGPMPEGLDALKQARTVHARSYAWQTIAYKLNVPDREPDLRRMWRGWLRSYVNYWLRTTNHKPKYYNDMHFLGACSQDHILSLKYHF